MDITNSLKQLAAVFGPAGMEDELREILKKQAETLVDEVWTDKLGNLICHKKGLGRKIMFAAHMDSIGFIVTGIETDGALRAAKIGSVYAAESIGVPVRFRNGVRGVIYMDEREKEELPSFSRLYIDIGAADREEAGKYVQIGDMAVFDTGTFLTGAGMLVTPYADDRAGCLVLLEMMKQVQESPNDLYFVFTVQEEINLLGARTASFAVKPDIGIAVDVAHVGRNPSVNGLSSCVCGKGAGIAVMDTRSVFTPWVVQRLKELADQKQISWQADVSIGSCNDADFMIIACGGAAAAAVTIPCKAVHCSQEMVSLDDIQSSIALCSAFACSTFN